MKNKKNIIILAIFAILAILAIMIAATSGNKDNKSTATENSNDIVLYYGNGCPHCEIVEKYIDQNDIKNKVSFDQREVFENRTNAESLTAKAEICGIPSDQIGVPLLWDGKNCLIGDEDIINFFKEKTNAQ